MKKFKKMSCVLLGSFALGLAAPLAVSSLNVKAATIEDDSFAYLPIPKFNSIYAAEIKEFGIKPIENPGIFESSLEYSHAEMIANESGTLPTISRSIKTDYIFEDKSSTVDYDLSWKYKDINATTVMDRYKVMDVVQNTIQGAVYSDEVKVAGGTSESIYKAIDQGIAHIDLQTSASLTVTITVTIGPFTIEIEFEL